MKRLRNRMLAVFLFVFLLFALVFGFFLDRVFADYTSENQLAALAERTHMVAESLQSDSLDADSALYLKRLKKHMHERITLLDANGRVLYDSHKIPEELDNHAVRKEITEVLAGKDTAVAVRVSESTQQEQYYVAAPVYHPDGKLAGVIRLAMLRSELGVSKAVLHSLFWLILSALFVSFLLTFLLTQKAARPMEEIMQTADELARQNYRARYIGKGNSDFQELGSTINQLAENLDNQTQALIQNEKRLQKLINHLIIGVMLLNEEKEVLMANEAMAEILQMPKEEMLGKPYVQITSSYGLSCLIEQAYRSKRTENDEIYFYYPKEQVADANVVPIPARQPGEASLIVLLYDITEIRRLEKVRSDFAANVSHELRTPITALRGFAETLLDGAMEDRQTLEQFLAIILKESTRLELLVNDILELSRLEQRQIPLTMEKVDPVRVIQDTFALVEKKAAEKGVAFLLQAEEEVSIFADPHRLKQIFTNLLMNALAYTQAGGQITAAVKKEDKEVLLEVTDTGSGIAEDQISRIFERFYRIDKARSRDSGGTGLGLSIVKYLVENMEGTISVKSRVGAGTTFTIQLPLAE